MSKTKTQPKLDLDRPELYINRELSWLDFNARVLEEALDQRNPLLERVKFMAIVASNLDEFYEVRVAGVLQLHESSANPSRPDGLTPAEQLERIAPLAHQQVAEQYRCWNEDLIPALAEEGIFFWEARQLEGEHLDFVHKYWEEELELILTPIVVDPAHPFPRVINKALCIGALLESQGQSMMGVATVPRVLPRILRLPDQGDGLHFVTLAGIMELQTSNLFRGYQVLGSAPFRVTRNSELYVNEKDADNLLEKIEEQVINLRQADAVRLEIAASAPDRLVKLLQRQFALDDSLVFRANGPVNLHRVIALSDLVPRPSLKYPPFSPVERELPKEPEPFFESIRNRDILLHHPYESFSTVIDFIRMAADDPKVLAIKQTIYRTGDDSQVAQALINAAERGKEVTVLVELKARGDEAANIEWAKSMEESGIHVVYGIMGLKIHCKLSMLVRRDQDRLRRYAHLGTGNYNHTTARFYTDLGLITAEPAITAEVAEVFNLLTAHNRATNFEQLLVAPAGLMRGMLDRIERESEQARAGRPAAIIAKMNGLMDPAIIKALYRASQAGVEIDLIVRGICCLRAGMPDISENIRVYSIIGRFLEHSRVFYFANGGTEEIWLGSADWMNRNLRGRVEVVFPIFNPGLRQRIYRDLIELAIADRTKSRQMRANGTYTRHTPSPGEEETEMQECLMRLALGEDLNLPGSSPSV
ncbi:MAG: polyphosphate kinase 1 [Gemmatimonadetes bacterium]|nr:polyphosphate kinase 1 [Gemmatimonadota bacterium]